jgi:tricorn protease
MRLRSFLAFTALLAPVHFAASRPTAPPAHLGYFRFPAISGEQIVFTAEGDLWRVPVQGGVAQRLTTHPAEESRPAISPDGRTLAYSASYEGPTEVYTMPLEGGMPVRRTYAGGNAAVIGWTPRGRILYATGSYSTLPSVQLATLDPVTNTTEIIPLAQASDGAYEPDGALVFTRLPFQGSYTKRYQGGTAQNLWRYTPGAAEAVPLTGDYAGTSKSPMVWQGRIYFLSDRDGVMNIWSMAEQGGDLKQHTHNAGFDAQSPSLSGGRIAYQFGADIHVLDIASGKDTAVPIQLVSDFDQTRERWIRSPADWIGTGHLSPNGDRVVFTARGQVFVLPARQGRVVEVTSDQKIRYRDAQFMPDGKSLLTLSDQSGELEFWNTPANGIGAATRLTTDAKVLRWEGVPSPDGKLIAHHDKDLQLWVYDAAKKSSQKIATGGSGGFSNLQWSPDSRWLAYTTPGDNQLSRIFLYNVASGQTTPLTSDRYDSSEPVWSPDGKWIWLLSDRNFVSLVGSPWGSRAPEPFFDKQTKVYQVALHAGERSPFRPDDELVKAPIADARPAKPADSAATPSTVVPVTIDLTGIQQRLEEVPVAPGNYSSLGTDGKRLYLISSETGAGSHDALRTLALDNKRAQPETFLDDVRRYELSLDRKKLLVQKGNDWYVLDAAAKAPADLNPAKVSLADWSFKLDPRDEWHQEFIDAWRLERDYFYDRGMNGVDWTAIRARFQPLVDRVTDRSELNDILAQMVGELSALHIFVRGGDLRRGQDNVLPASLGAHLARDERAGGYRVEHIYRSDPDAPNDLAPLARAGVDVHEGDVIVGLNGAPVLSAPEVGALLRDQAGKQVLLRVRPKDGGAERDVVVAPISPTDERNLRYAEWEYTRRERVEQQGHGDVGYVHLRAMGAGDMAQWTRDFYPVFNRQGLIIDVRHNNGGNIDSWILSRLLRQAWFYWQPRVGNPYWNMQYAFRGHIVVLTDEFTASDGEAFAEGFKRLGLGKVIGTRTWGGEIWLSSSNTLVDRGIATAAENGVYGPEGKWLIEGHGVDPDVVVDDPPHATFLGSDAQLDAAIKLLQDEIKAKPVALPAAPQYPDRSFPGKKP